MTDKTKNKGYFLFRDEEYYKQVMDMLKYIAISKRRVMRDLYKNMIVYKHKGANNWEDRRTTLLKSRSFYDEAQVLNKFDKFETIKLLFLVSRSLEEAMKDSNSSLEERAFCRLAENQAIRIALEKCKTHYPTIVKATLKEFKMLYRKLRALQRKSPSIINTHSQSFTHRSYLMICAYRLLGGGKKYQSLRKMADDLEGKFNTSSKVMKAVVSAKLEDPLVVKKSVVSAESKDPMVVKKSVVSAKSKDPMVVKKSVVSTKSKDPMVVKKSVVSAESEYPMVGVLQQEVGSCNLTSSPADIQKPTICTKEAQLEAKGVLQNALSNTKVSEDNVTGESFFEVDEEKLAKASRKATLAAAKRALQSLAKRKVFNRQDSTGLSPDFFTDWNSTGCFIMDELDKDEETADGSLKTDSLFYDKSKFKVELHKLIRKEKARKAEAYRREHNLPPPWAKPVDLTLANANMEPLGKNSSVTTLKELKLLEPSYLQKDGENE